MPCVERSLCQVSAMSWEVGQVGDEGEEGEEGEEAE